jgi:hypothetical protein
MSALPAKADNRAEMKAGPLWVDAVEKVLVILAEL